MRKKSEVGSQMAVSESPTAAMQPDHYRKGRIATRGQENVRQPRSAARVAINLVSVDANIFTFVLS